MKKLSLLLCLLVISSALFAATGFKIKGKVVDQENGMVKLTILQTDGSMKLDSVKLDKGKFEFKGTVDKASPAIISLIPSPKGVVFYIENSDIQVEMSSKVNPKQPKNPYSASIKGSKSNDQYIAFTPACDTITGMPMYDCLAKLIMNNPTSIYGPFIAQNQMLFLLKYEQLKEMVAHFKGDAVETFAYKKLVERLAQLEKVSVGKQAPEFQMPERNGNLMDYKNLLKTNSYVLIDFWASWCGPCRRENPNIVKAYKAYKDRGFEIFAVSFDTQKERWEKAIEADGLTWVQVCDFKGWQGPVPGLFAISSIPANALVDKNGTIVGRDLHGEELLNKLRELLGEAEPAE